MRRRFSVSQARSLLAELLDQVDRLGPLEITRRGETVAVLVSKAAFDRLEVGGPVRGDWWDLVGEFRRTTDLEELAIDQVMRGVRDASPGREISLEDALPD